MQARRGDNVKTQIRSQSSNDGVEVELSGIRTYELLLVLGETTINKHTKTRLVTYYYFILVGR